MMFNKINNNKLHNMLYNGYAMEGSGGDYYIP